jgi:DNA-binding protein Fis
MLRESVQHKKPELSMIVTPSVIKSIGLIDPISVRSVLSKFSRDKSLPKIPNNALKEICPTELIRPINDYLEYFIDTGLYDRLLTQALNDYPYLDESYADESVMLAIWRSFYLFSWDNYQQQEEKLYKFIRSTIKFYALTEKRNYQNLNSINEYTIESDDSYNPETIFGQKQVLTERVREFTNLIGNNEQFVQLLSLMSQNVTLKEACELLNLNLETASMYISKLKSNYPELKDGRSKSNIKYTRLNEKRSLILNYLVGITPKNDYENQIIESLINSKGNQSNAAKSLGVSVNEIRFFLQRYGYFNG